MLLVVVAINSQVVTRAKVSTIYLMPSLVESKSQLKALLFQISLIGGFLWNLGLPVLLPYRPGRVLHLGPWRVSCSLDKHVCEGRGGFLFFPPSDHSPPPPTPHFSFPLHLSRAFPRQYLKLFKSHLNCCNLISYAIRCLRLKKRELVILLSYHQP